MSEACKDPTTLAYHIALQMHPYWYTWAKIAIKGHRERDVTPDVSESLIRAEMAELATKASARYGTAVADACAPTLRQLVLQQLWPYHIKLTRMAVWDDFFYGVHLAIQTTDGTGPKPRKTRAPGASGGGKKTGMAVSDDWATLTEQPCSCRPGCGMAYYMAGEKVEAFYIRDGIQLTGRFKQGLRIHCYRCLRQLSKDEIDSGHASDDHFIMCDACIGRAPYCECGRGKRYATRARTWSEECTECTAGGGDDDSDDDDDEDEETEEDESFA